MSFVAFMLKRPYTVISGLILIALLGIGAVSRMPIDIFPEIDVPVVAVVWTYNGMPAQDIQNRILTLHERQLASEVDDIERIEASSYYGVGVEKIFLHQGADVTRAIAQLSSSALVVLKYMPPNITPPLVLRYGATDVPIIQLNLSSPSLPDSTILLSYQAAASPGRTRRWVRGDDLAETTSTGGGPDISAFVVAANSLVVCRR